MSESGTHLFIATPCYAGQVTTGFANSLLMLQHACLWRGIGVTVLLTAGDALITRTRQNLVAHFLEHPSATHLLFIDSDIVFEPEQVFRLLECDVEVTAAVYPTKRADWARLIDLIRAGSVDPEADSLSYVIELESPECPTFRGGFVKARYVGTGFLMIRRAALMAMIEHYPDLRYTQEHVANDPLHGSPWRCALFNCMIDEAGNYLSEDFSFCRRWTEMGGQIWADTGSRLDHVGSMTFHGNYASRFNKLPE
jgi:hypothetical protein